MIALDTNVIVRYLTGDDPDQQESARLVLEPLDSDRLAFVSREVAVELVWVLSRGYGLDRPRVADLLTALLHTRGLLFENAADVEEAIAGYRRGGPEFADRMILAAARRTGATPVYTFDLKLAKLAGARLVGGARG